MYSVTQIFTLFRRAFKDNYSIFSLYWDGFGDCLALVYWIPKHSWYFVSEVIAFQLGDLEKAYSFRDGWAPLSRKLRKWCFLYISHLTWLLTWLWSRCLAQPDARVLVTSDILFLSLLTRGYLQILQWLLPCNCWYTLS